jgi:hypothetical protein
MTGYKKSQFIFLNKKKLVNLFKSKFDSLINKQYFIENNIQYSLSNFFFEPLNKSTYSKVFNKLSSNYSTFYSAFEDFLVIPERKPEFSLYTILSTVINHILAYYGQKEMSINYVFIYRKFIKNFKTDSRMSFAKVFLFITAQTSEIPISNTFIKAFSTAQLWGNLNKFFLGYILKQTISIFNISVYSWEADLLSINAELSQKILTSLGQLSRTYVNFFLVANIFESNVVIKTDVSEKKNFVRSIKYLLLHKKYKNLLIYTTELPMITKPRP